MRLLITLSILALPVSAGASPFPALEAAKEKVSKPGLVERYGPETLHEGELRLPQGRGPFPIAVVIHGGCWNDKYEDRQGTAPLAEMLTKRGIATWNISYRRVGNAGGGWPGTFEDIAAGVDHIGKLARRYPLDLSRTAIVGHSAGAHLALWAAARPKLSGKLGTGALKPSAVAAIDGPGALAEFVGADQKVCGRPAIVPLMGGTPADKPAEFRAASPIDQVPLGVRTLLVKASLGFSMDSYEAKAKAQGDDVLTFTPEKAHHFDVITPGEVAGEAVADWLAANLFVPTNATAGN